VLFVIGLNCCYQHGLDGNKTTHILKIYANFVYNTRDVVTEISWWMGMFKMLRWKYIKAPTWKTRRDDGAGLSETEQIRVTVILYSCFGVYNGG
jgi:phage gpG-like protein